MVEAYSTCGRTRVLYASSFTDSFLALTFLFINLRVLFSLLLLIPGSDHEGGLELEWYS